MNELKYTVAAAKTDFNRGIIDDFSIINQAMDLGWMVTLHSKVENHWFPLVNARDKTERFFKTADAAISALRDIGFEVFALNMGKLR